MNRRFAIVLATLLVLSTVCCQVAFSRQCDSFGFALPSFDAGGPPVSIGLADFDGDGNRDVLTLQVFEGFFISFNAGDGTFDAPDFTFTGNALDEMISDLDGDGDPDVAIINRGGVSIHLNDGNGNLREDDRYVQGIRLEGGLMADFNGDSFPDIVVETPSELRVILNNGDGTFGAPSSYGTELYRAVDVGDVNNDGTLDIVTIETLNDRLTVFWNDGNGNFGSSIRSFHPDLRNLVLVDVNRDGLVDAVTSESGFPGCIRVLDGQGDGRFFGNGLKFTTRAEQMTVADLNADGIADVVTSDGTGDQIGILFGNGSGSLEEPVVYPVGDAPADVIAGDVNGDNRIDLLTANLASENFSLLINQGDGSFPSNSELDLLSAADFQYVDIDGDQIPDLVHTHRESNTNADPGVKIRKGFGDGTFDAPVTLAVGDPNDGPFGPGGLAISDFDQDGDVDITVLNFFTSNISVFLQNPGGGFDPAVLYDVADFPASILNSDLNGDGVDDLVVVSGNRASFSTLRNNGDGTFAAPVDVAPQFLINVVDAADMNGDNFPDLVLSTSSGLSLFLNDGGGSFPLETRFGTSGYSTLTIDDLDGDGAPDVIVNDGVRFVHVFNNSGDGTMTLSQQIQIPTINLSGHATTDVDADGDVDLVSLVGSTSGFVSVSLNQGNGNFQAPVDFDTGGNGQAIRFADLNNDQVPDLITLGEDGSELSVLEGVGDGTFLPPGSYNRPTGSPNDRQILADDVDNDGDIDLLIPGISILSIFENQCFEQQLPIQIPESVVVTAGTPGGGGVTELATSDNADLRISRAVNSLIARTEFVATGISPLMIPNSLEVTLEGSVFARSQVDQSIALFDYDAGSWVEIDSRPASRLVDSVVFASPTGDLSRFVEPGTGQVEVRVRFESVSPRQVFSSSTDQVFWSIR